MDRKKPSVYKKRGAQSRQKSESTRTVKLRKALCCAAELTLLVNREGCIEEMYGSATTLLGEETKLRHGDPLDIILKDQTFADIVSHDPEAFDERGYSLTVNLIAEKRAELRITKLPKDPVFVVVLRNITPVFREIESLKKQNIRYAEDLAQTYARWKDGVKKVGITAQQAAKAERLSTLGQVAANLAHEAKNLLMPVTIYSQLLVEKSRNLDEESKHLAEGIHSAADRVASLLHQILDAGKPVDLHREPIPVSSLTESLETILGSTLRRHEVKLEVALDSDLPLIEANQRELEQVFINIIANSIDAFEEAQNRSRPVGQEPKIQIRAFIEKEEKQGKQDEQRAEDRPPVVVISFKDNGPGFQDDTLSKIFDPFFTTKEAKKGTGLGLFVAHETIRNLGGTMEAFNIRTEGSGAAFEIRLPGIIEPETLNRRKDLGTTIG